MRLIALILAAFALTPGFAGAIGLDGTPVTLRYDFTGQASRFDTFTVGPGPEVNCTGGGSGDRNACYFLSAADTQTVDLGGSTITYAYRGPGSGFNVLPENTFNFLTLSPGFAIADVGLSTNMTGLDVGRLGFTSDSVSIYMSGLSVVDGSFFTVTLQPVPEPASFALLAFGVLGVGALVRRRDWPCQG